MKLGNLYHLGKNITRENLPRVGRPHKLSDGATLILVRVATVGNHFNVHASSLNYELRLFFLPFFNL